MQQERRVGERRSPSEVNSPQRMTIDELATACGLTVRNVRAYQQRGLLPPVERDGRRATYTQEHLARIRLVRALADHGLTLRTIKDLCERGTADAELARLSRQALTSGWRQGVRGPLNPANVEVFEAVRPGVIEEMERAGLISRPDGRPHANSAGLGLISALSARGIDLDVASRVVLMGAYAAGDVADELGELIDGVADVPDERAQLMVQLVATAFADVLMGRLTDEDRQRPDVATGTDGASR